MRFAITASDRYLVVFDAFLQAGWTPIRLFGTPCDGRMFRNTAVIQRAQGLKIGIQLSRMTERDLRTLADDGCEVLVVASYQWRIGEWQRSIPYAINFHPSLLPHFRGPYPLVNGLLQRSTRWGITCHKLAEFDAGDILAQRDFAVQPDETHETLDLRTQMASGALATQVAENFTALWAGAKPQPAGSYAPIFADAERTIDFGDSVAQILHTVRAFGRFECLTTVNGLRVHIGRAAGWVEAHTVKPGSVVHGYALATVVACSDGFIAILEWNLIAPEMITGTPAR